MRPAPLLSLALLAACRPAPEPAADDPYALVDVFIGTGGHGHTHPAATRPFGMIQAGPDTRLTGWDGCSGYHHDDDTIHGFSQTHLSGTGVSDYGDVLLMPFRWTDDADWTAAYPFAERFGHADERAAPGRYAVTLHGGIDVAIASGERVAAYRIAWPDGAPGLWIDLDHRDAVSDWALRTEGDTAVVGHRVSDAWAEDQRVHFRLETDRPFQSVRREGRRLALRFDDARGTDVVHLRLAISAVDDAGAAANLAAEPAVRDFDALAADAERAWREALGRVTVAGGTEAERRVFYTAAYHALLAPNRYVDADGRYRAMDGAVHRAEGFTPYTVFSLWDTYRAAHPFWALAFPERNADFLRSLLDDHDKGGYLPLWKLADHYTGCMIGYHAVPALADGLAKDLLPGEGPRALAAMVHAAERPVLGMPAYRRFGYIPADAEHESVSKTLEYAYDDACIAATARALAAAEPGGALPDGRSWEALADTFARRAGAWRHLYDPVSGFFRARRNGGFVEPFDPAEVNGHYTEANAWHYAFAPVHDVPGHARLAAGEPGAPGPRPSRLARQLDALFDADPRTTGRAQADITGTIGQYAHGNEPSHAIPWLYAHLGQPWKTQARVRQVAETQYTDRPDGLCGNEDCGQMSAWYLFAASGFYPVAPGSTAYTLAAPLFDTVTWRLPGGAVLRLIGEGEGPYVRAVTCRGEPWTRAWVDHAELLEGGDWVFTRSAEPVREWGVHDDPPPPLCPTDHVLPAPYADPAPRAFTGTLTVALRAADLRATIEYRRAAGEPWQVYTGPLPITGDAELRFRAVPIQPGVGLVPSPEQVARFRQRDERLRLRFVPPDAPADTTPAAGRTSGTPWAAQYAAGGNDALIDGLRGGDDWRTGDWQGYEGRDVAMVLDLGERRWVSEAVLGGLQDENAWIFFPTEVRVAHSPDGRRWTEAGTATPPVAWSAPGIRTHDFRVPVGAPARYLRVTVRALGTCPPGHKGAGAPCWVFADELRAEP